MRYSWSRASWSWRISIEQRLLCYRAPRWEKCCWILLARFVYCFKFLVALLLFPPQYQSSRTSRVALRLATKLHLSAYLVMRLTLCAASLVALSAASAASIGTKPRPVVIWHGMGDRYDSPSMERAIFAIQKAHKDIQVYTIRLSEDGSEDSQMTLLGNVNEQVSQCGQLPALIYNANQDSDWRSMWTAERGWRTGKRVWRTWIFTGRSVFTGLRRKVQRPSNQETDYIWFASQW